MMHIHEAIQRLPHAQNRENLQAGENGCARFCEQRMFHVDDPRGSAGGWYFEIRESAPRGPFASPVLATISLTDYLCRMREV